MDLWVGTAVLQVPLNTPPDSSANIAKLTATGRTGALPPHPVIIDPSRACHPPWQSPTASRMCNNPNLLPQVNQARCASIALMVFGILSLFSFFNLLNPWYWNAWAIVFILDGIGGILGIIASSVLICCGGEGIKTDQAKSSAASKHKCAMGCGIGAAVCFGSYVIAMVVAMVQLSQCEGHDICDQLMVWPVIGMIVGLLCVASAVVAAVFAGRAASAIETFTVPQAVPQAPVVAVAVASPVP